MQSVITESTHHKNKVENSACINGESNINTTFLPPDSLATSRALCRQFFYTYETCVFMVFFYAMHPFPVVATVSIQKEQFVKEH